MRRRHALAGLSTLRLHGSSVIVAVGLTAVIAYFAALSYAIEHWDYEEWMLLVLIPALVAVSSAGIVRITRNDAQPIPRLIVAALVLKLGASFVRYFVAFDLYGGSADASRYHEIGAQIADSFHRGDVTLSELLSLGRSTQMMQDLTGVIYTLTGPSVLGGFVLYSWIGFIGLFLFYRAVLAGLPEGDHRRYALLVFFLPSMLFWPSSIGKESVMMLSLGLCALGAARLVERHGRSWLPLGAGLIIGYWLRPHVMVVVLGALAVAMVFRRRPGRPPLFGPAGRVVVVGALVAGLAFVFGRTVEEFLPQSEAESVTDAAGELLDRAESGTAQGGSEIERLTPSSPFDYPYTAFSVLLRPTLLEAREPGIVLAALETTFLIVLAIASRKRFRYLLTFAFRRPYVLFAIAYTGIFAFAWSAFSNLGALARQRVQVWPFMLVLLALPAVRPRPSNAPTFTAAARLGLPQPGKAAGSGSGDRAAPAHAQGNEQPAEE